MMASERENGVEKRVGLDERTVKVDTEHKGGRIENGSRAGQKERPSLVRDDRLGDYRTAGRAVETIHEVRAMARNLHRPANVIIIYSGKS